jgi:cysteine dioxygenase
LEARGNVMLVDLVAALRALKVRARDFESLARFGRDAYTRVPLHFGNGVESRLLCWLPGQSTAIHDHGEAVGAARVLAGAVVERRYRVEHDIARLSSAELHEENTVFAAARGVVHDLTASGGRPVMTLHIYSPNLLGMRTFTRLAHG